jgi:hypothetical protein
MTQPTDKFGAAGKTGDPTHASVQPSGSCGHPYLCADCGSFHEIGQICPKNEQPTEKLEEVIKVKWHSLTCDLIKEMSKGGLQKNIPELNQYFSQWEEKCLNMFSQELSKQRKEMDLMLAMIESVTNDTSREEILEMIKNTRKSLTKGTK